MCEKKRGTPIVGPSVKKKEEKKHGKKGNWGDPREGGGLWEREERGVC